MASSFLKPRSVSDPAQGAFQYKPTVFLHESDTAAGLETLMNAGAAIQQTDVDNYWVIESIEYQVVVVKPEIGMNPAVLSYSALIHATQVEII